jgi:TRAP-type mannitol/chloroaromatic compound transport system permease small subunit
LIAYYGFDFAYLAFEIGEKSGDPGGLYYRFIIKSIIPISFIFRQDTLFFLVVQKILPFFSSSPKSPSLKPSSDVPL